jgi:hypothetical protein
LIVVLVSFVSVGGGARAGVGVGVTRGACLFLFSFGASFT